MMGNCFLELVDVAIAEELLQFEIENRSFFASVTGDFGDDYYQLESMVNLLKEIEEEQKLDQRYMYVLRNEDKELVGRVNLFSIVRGPLNKAEVGYRIGKKYNGNGYGTKGVRLVIQEAFNKHRFHRLEAATAPNNIGSQVVLIKNQFQFVGRTPKYINISGEWLDSLNFTLLEEEYKERE